MNRVVSGFLDYARPSAGNAAPTDVNRTIERTLAVVGPDLGDIEVHTDLDGDLPRVKIDAERLRQVLINLSQNANQAMEGSGELRVSTLARTRREVSGELRRWVELWVTDTGPGIPQKVLSTLFVPFVTTKDRGTGLGLAISQRIVSSAGGHIEVRSSEGVGTTFVLRLPAVDDGARLPQNPSSPPEGASISSGAIGSGDEGRTEGEVPTSLATSR